MNHQSSTPRPVDLPAQNPKPKHTLLAFLLIFSSLLLGTQIYGYLRYKIFPSNPIFLITSLPSATFLKTTLTGHNDYVNSVAISPDNSTLVSGSADETIKIWRMPK